MKKNDNKESIVKHYYNIPKSEKPITENYRELTIVTLNQTIHLISSFEKEDLIFLANLGLDMLKKVKEVDGNGN